jgi:SRSO17 transposase
MINIERQLIYPVALLLSTSTRKSCEAMAIVAKVSGDKLCRILKEKTITMHDLINLARKVLVGQKWYLIIDDTIIEKIYSKVIEGACDNYDSSDGSTYRSLCSITAVLTDGKTVIPIDQALWLSAEFAQNEYKKKWEVAHEIIAKIRAEIPIYMLIADGLYATENMLKNCLKLGIYFEMRFHSNRVIEYKGNKVAIRELKDLELKGRRSARTKAGIWKGMKLHFTAVKRTSKTGKITIVYQVSNFKMSAREHAQIYGFRWGIEKFFRTAKQHLGLNHCQAQSRTSQENHIMNVFFSYALLQIERKKFSLKNVEAALKRLKRKNYENAMAYFKRSGQIFEDAYA